MSFLSKTALGLLAAAGVMALTAPEAEARHRHHRHCGHSYYGGYSRVYHGPSYYRHHSYYRHYPRRVVYRTYDPYYYGGYYPHRYYSSGPRFSISFGGHGFHRW